MNAARQVGRLGQTTFFRSLYTNRAVLADVDPHSTETYKRLKANQELYQREDTVEEVYLKGGLKSKILFNGILGGTIVSLIWSGIGVYDLISH